MREHHADARSPSLAPGHDFFSKRGLLPGRWDDMRRFPRFYCRAVANALIAPPRGDGAPWQIEVLTEDVSRSGMRLIAPLQLFPEQSVELWLSDGKHYALKVVWCRRLGPQQYAAGCEFAVPGTGNAKQGGL